MTSQQTKNTVHVVGDDRLLTLKESLFKDLPETEEYSVLKEDLIAVIDNFRGVALEEGLRKRFGANTEFRIEMKHYVNVFAAKPTYRYVIKQIEWKGGPNTHQVFFFIKERFGYYLESQEYNESMFKRTIPDIEKRYTAYYRPLDISDTKFGYIGVNVREVQTMVDDKIVDTYCTVTAKDEKLGIKDEVRGRTLAEALTGFQQKLEAQYYREKLEGDYYKEDKNEDKEENNKKRASFKSYRQRLMYYSVQEQERAQTQIQSQQDSGSDSGSGSGNNEDRYPIIN